MFRFALAHAVDLNKIGVGDNDDREELMTREFRSNLVYDNPRGGGGV